MQSVQNNNCVSLVGTVGGEFKFSHEVYCEKFYNFSLETPRLSGNCDVIVVTVSEQLLHSKCIKVGDKVCITGQFRSYNNNSPCGNKLILTVFAKEIAHASAEKICGCINEISLTGYVCKPPIFRITPFGREITDLLIAVNRTYNKSDYIPCIAWGRNAKSASLLGVGDKVVIQGRVQSREYQKKLCDSSCITKTAYEVSISKITKAD